MKTKKHFIYHISHNLFFLIFLDNSQFCNFEYLFVFLIILVCDVATNPMCFKCVELIFSGSTHTLLTHSAFDSLISSSSCCATTGTTAVTFFLLSSSFLFFN